MIHFILAWALRVGLARRRGLRPSQFYWHYRTLRSATCARCSDARGVVSDARDLGDAGAPIEIEAEYRDRLPARALAATSARLGGQRKAPLARGLAECR